MTASPWFDAFAHHIWATRTLFDACAELSEEQLAAVSPGTYGSIHRTFAHLVLTDVWFLSFFRDGGYTDPGDAALSMAELRAVFDANAPVWMDIIANPPDPELDIVDVEDGRASHAPAGLRLALVADHGTDHRSQICTSLTALGIEPPQLHLWAYGLATGRHRVVPIEPVAGADGGGAADPAPNLISEGTP